MASDHMLRIPRSDFQGKHILVNVSKNGPALLDLKLIGTEGTVPYLTTGNWVNKCLGMFFS